MKLIFLAVIEVVNVSIGQALYLYYQVAFGDDDVFMIMEIVG
jgi:hypothetical protein